MTRMRSTSAPVLTGLLLAGAAVAACAPDGPDARPAPSTSPDATAPVSTPPSTVPRTVASTDPLPTTPRAVPDPPTGPFGSSGLAFFGDCPGLLSFLRAEAGERVTAWGLGGGWWFDGPMMATAETTEAGADASRADGAPVADVDHSTTNVQEEGVDEGDVVETDGTYLYTVVQDGLRVVDLPAAELAASVELPMGDHQLLLDGDRLVVTTQGWTTGEDTIVSVFDVGDPTSPALLRRTHLEGRTVAARAADGTVRLVLSASLQQRLPFVQPQMFGLDEDRALERNREIVATSAVEDWLPRWFDEDVRSGTFGEMQPAIACDDVAAPATYAGLGITWIASIDLDADAVPVGTAGIVSTGETVYASASSLYVATVPWDWYAGDDRRQDEAPPTLVHAFTLGEGAEAEYRATGEVPGMLLSQFSMSELDGVLRVAATETDWTDGDTESSVRTLDAATMDELGSVGGLGKPGEQIRGVRFLGTTGYVVTFRQTDPLYVVDLTDPAAPARRGELEIPGYSAYLHPVGDGLLLGVGQDADATGRTTGTQLALFDVSDPGAPQRISTLPIGGWSEAEWDHHAFTFWAADGTIVLPVSPGWSDCADGPGTCLASRIANTAGGVVVARLVDRELQPVGAIDGTDDDSGCWNPLRRTVVVGDELVVVGIDSLRIVDRATLAERDRVAWSWADQYGCAWYGEG